jgi:hypothetical protein
MKPQKYYQIALLITLITISHVLSSQVDSTGLPGDNFSLSGAIEMLKEAKNLENFEKLINTESNYVNNLDLNEDGETDYVKVIDNTDGDVHAIVLQVPVSKRESQDIAVIEIEKTGDKEAILQIIGDEDIYGENIIVEPFEEEGQGNKGGHNMMPVRLVVNVWGWSSIKVVYRPAYVPYVSPFYWKYYPKWWTPWRPHPWKWHYTRRSHFRTHHHVIHTHRVVRAHKVYTPVRVVSPVVKTKNTVAVNKYRTNNKVAKVGGISKTTQTKVVSRGNKKAVVSKSTTKKGVTKGNKKAGVSKSTRSIKATNGNKSIAGKNKTKKVGATNGKKSVTGKKSKTVAAKKGPKGAAAGKKTTKKAKVKKKN